MLHQPPGYKGQLLAWYVLPCLVYKVCVQESPYPTDNSVLPRFWFSCNIYILSQNHSPIWLSDFTTCIVVPIYHTFFSKYYWYEPFFTTYSNCYICLLNLALTAFTETSTLSQPNAAYCLSSCDRALWKTCFAFFPFDVTHQQSGSTWFRYRFGVPPFQIPLFLPHLFHSLKPLSSACLAVFLGGPELYSHLTVYIWLPGLANFIVQYPWCLASSLALPNSLSKWHMMFATFAPGREATMKATHPSQTHLHVVLMVELH